MISALSTSFFTGIADNPDVPAQVSDQAQVELAGGVPFLSDDDLSDALGKADVDATSSAAIVDENSAARIDALRTSLSLLGLIALLALFTAGSLPTRPTGAVPDEGSGSDPEPDRGQPPVASPA